MPDLENAVTRLYEDISLTDELTDEPAKVLLEWGEGRVRLMVNTMTDEDAFEERFKQLRQLMKSINRFTGRRHEMPPEEQADYVRKIMERAQELGYQSPYGRVGEYLERQKSLENGENIHLLTQLIETGQLELSDRRPWYVPPKKTNDNPWI